MVGAGAQAASQHALRGFCYLGAVLLGMGARDLPGPQQWATLPWLCRYAGGEGCSPWHCLVTSDDGLLQSFFCSFPASDKGSFTCNACATSKEGGWHVNVVLGAACGQMHICRLGL
jgi:hypothetical protein